MNAESAVDLCDAMLRRAYPDATRVIIEHEDGLWTVYVGSLYSLPIYATGEQLVPTVADALARSLKPRPRVVRFGNRLKLHHQN